MLDTILLDNQTIKLQDINKLRVTTLYKNQYKNKTRDKNNAVTIKIWSSTDYIIAKTMTLQEFENFDFEKIIRDNGILNKVKSIKMHMRFIRNNELLFWSNEFKIAK